eukprot:TRINITY_DN5662_c0_g1_i1.p2 TRINITY_DN5662_c0_g1~~TRINITY_DN5662_c0_g1_i1.p2  ORF type:complete len:220 (+),score=26.70 TRINITY_DN5662_c0_g1_i1:359-1018(+)
MLQEMDRLLEAADAQEQVVRRLEQECQRYQRELNHCHTESSELKAALEERGRQLQKYETVIASLERDMEQAERQHMPDPRTVLPEAPPTSRTLAWDAFEAHSLHAVPVLPDPRPHPGAAVGMAPAPGGPPDPWRASVAPLFGDEAELLQRWRLARHHGDPPGPRHEEELVAELARLRRELRRRDSDPERAAATPETHRYRGSTPFPAGPKLHSRVPSIR